MKTAREYVLEMLFLGEKKLNELQKQEDDSGRPGGSTYRMGQIVAYREVVSQLREIRDFTDPSLYVSAGESAGKRVWLHWEERWMSVEQVEEGEYRRAVLHGKLDDGSDWETDATWDEPLSLTGQEVVASPQEPAR